MFRIYFLIDPRAPENVRYVGATRVALRKRLNNHIHQLSGTKRKLAWLKSLHGKRLKPHIEWIDTCSSAEEAKEREQFWIMFYRPDLNETPAERRRHACNAIAHLDRRNDVYRQRQSEAHKGKTLSPEARRKVSLALHQRQVSSETRAKMSKNNGMRSLEVRTKVSNALKDRKLTDQHRANIAESQKGRKHPPEVRRKMALAQKRRWARESAPNAPRMPTVA